jgi:hypothetical protein
MSNTSPRLQVPVVADPGEWDSESPITEYQYTWYRCPADNPNTDTCTSVQSGKSNTYTPKDADLGKRLWLSVAAKNRDGWSVDVYSYAITMVITRHYANNTALPTMSNTSPKVGQVITANPGTWESESPISEYQYTWYRCPADNPDTVTCKSAQSGSSNTYTVKSGDAGKRLWLSVAAKNRDGWSVNVYSYAITMIVAK